MKQLTIEVMCLGLNLTLTYLGAARSALLTEAGDHSLSATALARGHNRWMRFTEFTNSPHMQA